MLLLLVSFLVLTGILIRQIYFTIKERFGDKKRLSLIALMSLILILAVFYPFGIINFERFEGNNLLFAQIEGSANCTVTFKFKADFTFTKRTICFGIEDVSGTYQLKGDTVFLTKPSNRLSGIDYAYGVIEKNPGVNTKCLRFYKSSTDTNGIAFAIIENKLPN
jgi:hypothetical protein